MALSAGTVDADSGMALAIFTQFDQLLSPPLQAAVDGASAEAKPAAQAALDAARGGWRKLAFAVAKGVVEHLVSNLEISGVTVSGSVSLPVNGNTGSTAAPTAHTHTVGITPAATVTLTQNNGGTGRVS